MENLEFIENYFKGDNNEAQKKQFEKKIMEDATFAEEVAFYISANGLVQEQVQEEKKQRFREMYDQQKVISIKGRVRNRWKYMAAASFSSQQFLLRGFFPEIKIRHGDWLINTLRKIFKH